MAIKMTVVPQNPIQVSAMERMSAIYGFSPYIDPETGTWIVYDDVNGWHDTGAVARGERGRDGANGRDGIDGQDGYTPEKGVDYFDGEKGEKGDKGDPGKDGTMSFEDLTPEQKAMLKGDKGDKGDQGEQGIQGIQGIKGNDGYTPVKGIDYFDGEKGDKGDTGAKGTDGHTPVKGTDYFTDSDIADIRPLIFRDLIVEPGMVYLDGTYADYPYALVFTLFGVRENMLPEVIFPLEMIEHGCPVCQSEFNTVIIFFDSIPETAFTLPAIIVHKGGV